VHVRLRQKGRIDFGADVREDLPPTADLVVISAHDSDLRLLAGAADALSPLGLSLTLANYLTLLNPASIPALVETTLARARIVVLRMVGGAGYWIEGAEALRAWAWEKGTALFCVPAGPTWDETFAAMSAGATTDEIRDLWRYFAEGGPANIEQALVWLARAAGADAAPKPPVAMPLAGFLSPGDHAPADILLVIYRALAQAGDTEPVNALRAAFDQRGLRLATVFAASLKNPVCREIMLAAVASTGAEVILNATAFAAQTHVLFGDRPVLQTAFAGQPRREWAASARGLPPGDLAMHVVMPELDGRIFAGPAAFKVQPATEASGALGFALLQSDARQVGAIADRAAAQLALRRTAPAARRVAIVLANYPNRDGRLANGVGLDTPASAALVIRRLREHGYAVADAPDDGAGLMARLTGSATNVIGKAAADHAVLWPLADYRLAFDRLAPALQEAITRRWGPPEQDPHAEPGGLRLALHRFGHLVIGIQPSRGYDIDPAASFHDPDLMPPHRYAATYLWLRHAFRAHAIVHFGKHGNLEWLPGKAVGLSQECWPQALLGPLPHLYPFIVNDPGEGMQAKRRTAAVVIDHLTPPMTRADLHGDLARLETLLDEYALAQDLDPRRARLLGDDIAGFAGLLALDADLACGALPRDEQIRRLDAHLCDLKEMQIRDGLHVFGKAPEEARLTDLAVAIARCPRAGDSPAAASLHRAIADDLALSGFDPLTRDLAAPYHGPRPAVLATALAGAWRTVGDTVERIEHLARALVAGGCVAPAEWSRARPVLDWIGRELMPALQGSAEAEAQALLAGLDGRAVPPGASGAPTRGRPDVLPTGRNFHAFDPRTVPTPAAWRIGQASAEALLARHWSETGTWLRSVAISAWGTANMRTGGDDVAQALALIGCRPLWEESSGTVTGFEILTSSELRRPRVDVTLRVSGLFRDAFPAQLDLVDSAVRAVAALDEDADQNPLAAAARRDGDTIRVFGAKPGAYGAGLQALIDENGWTDRRDFAEAYLAWGAHAYGGGRQGVAARAELERRLGAVDAVVQAQDNREHDILDSDDYYQFMGGLAATSEVLSGRAPRIYLTDTSRPDSPLPRTLEEEIARVVRGRAANPRWIAGVMRHGYKGAFEMAATVDYLFAFAATTDAVKPHHFDQLFESYLGNEQTRAFMAEANPDALRETAQRFLEAIRRSLWTPRANSAHGLLQGLAADQRGSRLES
jgi:cobaltochelatase CobN